MIMNGNSFRCVAIAFLMISGVPSTNAQLLYEGSLRSGGIPASGRHDFRFALYDGPEAGASQQIGDVVLAEGVEVREGRFSVDLDFGPEAENLKTGWLEIEVAASDEFDGYTTLEPRQRIIQAATGGAIATGAVMFFDLTVCPSGWSEYVLARGRAIVGLQQGGTLAGTVGLALADLQTPVHGHQFSFSGPTGAAGTHNHNWAEITTSGGDLRWGTYNSQGDPQLVTIWPDLIGIGGGSGYFPLTSGPAGASWYTDIQSSHSHSLNSGTVPTSTTTGALPYLQLLACQKD